MDLPEKLKAAGVSIDHEFVPGDLGWLVYVHGVQNSADYGFNEVHEAYCARIAVDYILDTNRGRSRIWLARKEGRIVGSILIVERPSNVAQLRILFVDVSVRGIGLGRWLVEDSIRYCREMHFESVYLWTVEGLDRAISVYESVGFRRMEQKTIEEWGGSNLEVRFELDLRQAEP